MLVIERGLRDDLHGAAYGRVLVGLDVPNDDVPALATFVHELGYETSLETENPAYRLFLS